MTCLPATGVYVHWPWCLSKCPYCDFASSPVDPAAIDQAAFRAALLTCLDQALDGRDAALVGSVFFGGGTPSLINPATVAALLDRLAGRASLAAGFEVTLEANPGTVTAQGLDGLKAAGVTRMSLGVQSLLDQELRLLGRLHDSAQALAAIDLISKRFGRWSIDLIYGRPGQSLESWEEELAHALSLGLRHLSLYQLTLEPETVMGQAALAGRIQPLDGDAEAGFYNQTLDQMARAGLPSYEVSNFAASPDDRCRHNLEIWQGGAYLGLGPGAHGRLLKDGVVFATESLEDPQAWMDQVRRLGHGYKTILPLSPGERAQELLLLGLRLTDGIDPDRFRLLSGRALETVIDRAALDRLVGEGLMEYGPDFLRTSARGRPLLDGLIALLLPE